MQTGLTTAGEICPELLSHIDYSYRPWPLYLKTVTYTVALYINTLKVFDYYLHWLDFHCCMFFIPMHPSSSRKVWDFMTRLLFLIFISELLGCRITRRMLRVKYIKKNTLKNEWKTTKVSSYIKTRVSNTYMRMSVGFNLLFRTWWWWFSCHDWLWRVWNNWKGENRLSYQFWNVYFYKFFFSQRLKWTEIKVLSSQAVCQSN